MINGTRTTSGRVSNIRNRVYFKWLWWKHTYTFNWAHKPLCKRFSRDVIRVGYIHMCRSCTLLYFSAIIAVIIDLFADLPAIVPTTVFYSLLALVAIFSHPDVYQKLSRPIRDIMRCATGTTIAIIATLLLNGNYTLGLSGTLVLTLVYFLSLPAYGKWKKQACNKCPEINSKDFCTGYKKQAEHIRKFELEAENHLMQQYG